MCLHQAHQAALMPRKRVLFRLLDGAVARANMLSTALAAAAAAGIALLPLLAHRMRVVEAALLAGVAHAQLRGTSIPGRNMSGGADALSALFAAAGLLEHSLQLADGNSGRCQVKYAVLQPARSTALEALVLVTPLLGAPARVRCVKAKERLSPEVLESTQCLPWRSILVLPSCRLFSW